MCVLESDFYGGYSQIMGFDSSIKSESSPNFNLNQGEVKAEDMWGIIQANKPLPPSVVFVDFFLFSLSLRATWIYSIPKIGL
jgi:hypothetical protein